MFILLKLLLKIGKSLSKITKSIFLDEDDRFIKILKIEVYLPYLVQM